jgi:hypothetical protein
VSVVKTEATTADSLEAPGGADPSSASQKPPASSVPAKHPAGQYVMGDYLY